MTQKELDKVLRTFDAIFTKLDKVHDALYNAYDTIDNAVDRFFDMTNPADLLPKPIKDKATPKKSTSKKGKK